MGKTIYLLLGPSGCGKSTLGNFLKTQCGIPEVVSHTTRKPRKGEINGKTYYFVSKKEFDSIEKVEQVEYAGNHYCVSKKEIDEKLSKYDKIFAIVDKNGVKQFKKFYPKETKVIYIYITLDEIKERMEKRGDSQEEINKRLEHAIQDNELQNIVYADFVIVNRNLEESKKLLNCIIHL